jgi:hypothetical protein
MSEEEKLPWLTSKRVPDGYWNLDENKKKYCQWLLHTKLKDSWKSINRKIILDNHGSGIIDKFNGSPQKLAEFGGSTLKPWE